MKNRIDCGLIAAAVLSLAACAAAWLFEIRLLLILPALPFFCIQLFICRRTAALLPRLLPLLLIAAFAGTGWLILMMASGWDGLLGLIMLLASISPAVSVLLTWGGFILHSRHAGKRAGP